MRLKYVKTSNHERFLSAVKALESAGRDSRIALLSGEPGTGKTSTVDNWGSLRNAFLLEGMPGMSPAYMRDYLADQTGALGKTRFATDKALVEYFKRTQQPILLDEAQHALPDKAAALEYLRRVADQSGVLLLLICHTSERHRFAENNLAHIGTRISAEIRFETATPDDCALYLKELCEVAVDGGIARKVHEQSRGRYRLMASACLTLEALAARLSKSALSEADIKGFVLCEDAMKALRKGA